MVDWDLELRPHTHKQTASFRLVCVCRVNDENWTWARNQIDSILFTRPITHTHKSHQPKCSSILLGPNYCCCCCCRCFSSLAMLELVSQIMIKCESELLWRLCVSTASVAQMFMQPMRVNLKLPNIKLLPREQFYVTTFLKPRLFGYKLQKQHTAPTHTKWFIN